MITLLVKASVLLLAAALVDRVLVRAPASVRHLVWTAALLGTLVLPLRHGDAPSVDHEHDLPRHRA